MIYTSLPLILFGFNNAVILVLLIDALVLILFLLWGYYETEKYRKLRKKSKEI